MNENLTKAEQGLSMAVDDLRAAFNGASAVEFLLLMTITEKADQALRDLRAMINAIEADEGGGN